MPGHRYGDRQGQEGPVRDHGGADDAAIAAGVEQTYLTANLRHSQMAPLTMYEERNTGTNLPAEIKISAVDGDAYKFLFIAKGGGSANKSYLFQETKALLNEETLLPWLFEKLQALGTAACPPYHLAVVIGGTSAEFAVETAKLASTHFLDSLPTTGSPAGHGFPRPRPRAQGARPLPAHGDRRPVRREVLLPRRADHPPAPPRGELPGGDGGVLAQQIVRRSARSPRTASSSNSSNATRRSSCRTSPTSTSTTPTSCALTSPVRWTRSSPPSPPTR